MKKTLLFFSFVITSFFISSQVNAQIIFYVTNPPQFVGTHDFTYASGWGGFELDTIFIQEQLVLVDDGTADDSLGCNPLVNGAQLAGKIAVVYRGSCEFGMKALNAQNAGAIGVIIINNVAGPPIVPGAGAVGAQVTIPVIMISQATGAALRPEIDAGTVTAMIGNKTGVFANDLGAFKQHIVLPNSWAIPSGLATNAAAFEIPVGAWVYNYGQNAQTGVTLNATITLAGNVIYNQTSAGASMNPLDSLYISLPVFSQATYADGLYRLEYSITSSGTEDFPDDNNLITHFWIQPDHYSKSRFDTLTMQPIRTSHYRIAGSIPDFMWCTIMDHPDAGNLTAYGVSFSATAANTSTLANKSIEVNLYEWNDVIIDSMTFNNLTPLQTAYYDYLDNTLSGIFVTAWFDNPQPLVNNTKYLTCVRTPDADVFIGSDDNLDYQTSWDAYNPSATQFDDLSVFFPIRSGTDPNFTWNGVGFGSNPVPSVILHTSTLGIGIEENNTATNVSYPYPNPGTEFITIPLNITYNGKVTVNVYDLAGKVVKSEVVNMNNTNNLSISTAQLTNGMYHFNLKFSDNSTADFPVVITK